MADDRKKALRRRRRKQQLVIKAAKPPKPRKCGGCTACCTSLEVPDVPKLAGEHCKHECAEGCAIYDDRPEMCQSDFKCSWLEGWGLAADRPDRIGWFVSILIHPQFNEVAGGSSSLGALLHIREQRDGAVTETRFDEALRDWLTLQFAVMVQRYVGTQAETLTLYGPKIPRGVKVEKNPTAPSSEG